MNMNISDNISKTLSSSYEPSIPTDIYSSQPSSPSFFSNISWITWLMIILILSFLGFNIFIYLAKGTQDITSFFSPLVNKITDIFGGVTSQVVDVTSEGTKGLVDTTADVVDKSLSTIQDVSRGENIKKTNDSSPDDALNKALGTNNTNDDIEKNDYEAQQSYSSINSRESGWCFIGEEQGNRTCTNVGMNDQCMSGDIFPSNEICINPNLRV